MEARGFTAALPGAGAAVVGAGVCASAIPAARAATVANLVKYVFMGVSPLNFDYKGQP
jgi:hypothetical protein